MGASERRAEVLRILVARRSETAPNLALELGVSVSTIRRDILTLMVDYPLETQQGNNGCVKLADWYHPHKRLFSREQQQVLTELAAVSDARQSRVLRELLSAYGSMKPNEIGGTP